MAKYIVYRLLCYLEGHTLLGVLAHEIAVLTGKLAVLRNNERDIFRRTFLPTTFNIYKLKHTTYITISVTIATSTSTTSTIARTII